MVTLSMLKQRKGDFSIYKCQTSLSDSVLTRTALLAHWTAHDYKKYEHKQIKVEIIQRCTFVKKKQLIRILTSEDIMSKYIPDFAKFYKRHLYPMNTYFKKNFQAVSLVKATPLWDKSPRIPLTILACSSLENKAVREHSFTRLYTKLKNDSWNISFSVSSRRTLSFFSPAVV